MFDLKDYTTVSVSVGYDWKKFSIQGRVGNLFDVVNYNVHELFCEPDHTKKLLFYIDLQAVKNFIITSLLKVEIAFLQFPLLKFKNKTKTIWIRLKTQEVS
jgi:hypothetical protein